MGKNVLVVDDDPVVLRSCEKILKGGGYEVRLTASPREGLSLMGAESFDVLVTDIKMPEMEGIELIRQVRSQSKSEGVGIILITGFPSQENIREALKLGIVDYLPKPFSPSLLLEVVARAVGAAQASSEEAEGKDKDNTEAMMLGIGRIIQQYKGRPGSLLPVLHAVKNLAGDLTPLIQRYIARGLNLPVSEVYGVVSFYPSFSGKRSARDSKPKGKNHVKVCVGPACIVKRAEEIVERIKDILGIDLGGMTPDKSFSLEAVKCLGMCGLAPVIVVGKETHGNISAGEAEQVIEKYRG